MPCLACDGTVYLTLNLLTTTIVAPPSNASKWQMGFNSAFKGLISELTGHSVSQICSFPYVSIVVWLIGNLLFTFVLIHMSGR